MLLNACKLESDSSKNEEQTISKKAIIQHHGFIVDTLLTDLKVPWAIDWLPNGKAIISEKRGPRISLFDLSTNKLDSLVNAPKAYVKGDGGLLDILIHPNYAQNQLVFLAYSVHKADSSSTVVVDRAKLIGNKLEHRKRLFTALPYYHSNGHYGCRLLVKDRYLYITVGDRLNRDSAQILRTHNGKVMRLYIDGSVPNDNPFRLVSGALPEIWTYGHRNPQGMAIHPTSQEIWINEHGPKGGDEINILGRGKDYGWPTITYGEEYAGGPIGDGLTTMKHMEQPIYYYTPSIAPSDFLFYTGTAFPEWQGDLFIGALALRHLNHLELTGNEVTHEERLLEGVGRIRSISQSREGFIYLGIDSGMILRLRPI